MTHTSNERKGNKFLEIDYHRQANLCDVITQTRILQHSSFTFFFIPDMMISAQQKSFCVLHFSKTKSVISVQRAFH